MRLPAGVHRGSAIGGVGVSTPQTPDRAAERITGSGDLPAGRDSYRGPSGRHCRDNEPRDHWSEIVASAAVLADRGALRRPSSHARIDLMDIAFPQLAGAAHGLMRLGVCRG